MGLMNGKVSIVTGGNTGIGKETVRGLAKEGGVVVLACRDVVKGEAARADIVASVPGADVRVRALDLADTKSIRAFAAGIRSEFQRLDVLVNNAGIWPTKRTTTFDGFETTFGTNHVGTFLLTNELLGLLKATAPSRIVVVSSGLHRSASMRWDDLGYANGAFPRQAAYSQSKLANVLFSNALARRLAGTGVTVNALHPGVVATELTRDYPQFLVKLAHLFLLTPEKGAATTLHVATSPSLANVTGKYFEKSAQTEPSRAALDEAAQEKLWALTEKLLGVAEVRVVPPAKRTPEIAATA